MAVVPSRSISLGPGPAKISASGDGKLSVTDGKVSFSGDGEDGSLTIGQITAGFKQKTFTIDSVSVKVGEVEHKFADGSTEKLALKVSANVVPLTFTLTGTRTITKTIKLAPEGKHSDKITMDPVAEYKLETPEYPIAGSPALPLLPNPPYSFAAQDKVKVDVSLDTKQGSDEATLTINVTVSCSIRPFSPKPPSPKPPSPKPPVKDPKDWPPIPPIYLIPVIIAYINWKGEPETLSIVGKTSEIQMTEIKAGLKELSDAESDVSTAATSARSSEVSTEAELNEATELETSLSADAEAAETAVTAAEGAEEGAATALEAAAAAETGAEAAVAEATAEVASATAAEVAADASEAADWWTIVGGIASGVAIATATAAVVAAGKKLSEAKDTKARAGKNKAKATADKGKAASEKAAAQTKLHGIKAHKADTTKRIQDLKGKIDATKAQEAKFKKSYTSIKDAQRVLKHHAAQVGIPVGSPPARPTTTSLYF